MPHVNGKWGGCPIFEYVWGGVYASNAHEDIAHGLCKRPFYASCACGPSCRVLSLCPCNTRPAHLGWNTAGVRASVPCCAMLCLRQHTASSVPRTGWLQQVRVRRHRMRPRCCVRWTAWRGSWRRSARLARRQRRNWRWRSRSCLVPWHAVRRWGSHACTCAGMSMDARVWDVRPGRNISMFCAGESILLSAARWCNVRACVTRHTYMGCMCSRHG